MGIATKAQVQAFLNDFCPAAQKGEVVYAGQREENRRFRMANGLDHVTIMELLASLAVEMYSSGPEPHYKRPQHSVWKFGPDCRGIPLYVKLADWRPGHPYFHCISFKAAQPPLQLPYRK